LRRRSLALELWRAADGRSRLLDRNRRAKDSQLADGSTVQLNTDSVIKVEMLEPKRVVTVLNGEVFFEVAHDAARPFYVNVRDNVIKVVGTAFAVRAINDEVSVTVTKGLVELSEGHGGPKGDATPEIVQLRPSEKAVIQKDEEVVVDVVDQDQLSRELAWQKGYIVFDNEPLGDVIKEVSRYTDMEFQISDPSIRNISVRGRYEIGAIDSLLESLEVSFGIRVTRPDSKVVYLSRRVR
jgi:transmembrane sensor